MFVPYMYMYMYIEYTVQVHGMCRSMNLGWILKFWGGRISQEWAYKQAGMYSIVAEPGHVYYLFIIFGIRGFLVTLAGRWV